MTRLRSFLCFGLIGFAPSVFVQESPKVEAGKKGDVQAAVSVVSFRGHATEVMSLAFSADGSQIASTSDQDLCIWDSANGKEIRRLKVDSEGAIGFSRDFGRLAIAQSFHVDVPAARRGMQTLLDTTNGTDIWSIEPHGKWDRSFPFPPAISALAFTFDGKRLATAGSVTKVGGPHGLPGGVVKIWDTVSGKELQQFGELSTRADAVVFSADGKYLAAGTQGASGELPEPGEVHVWDSATGQRLRTIKTRPDVEQGGNPGSVASLAFHSKATRLAAAVSDGTVRLWELPSGKELFEMRGHQVGGTEREVDKFTGIILRGGSVRSVAFNPDGTLLASAGYDHVVRVWNTENGSQTRSFRFDSARINAVAFSPDGKRLAASGSNATKAGEVVIWSMNDKPESLAAPILPTLKKAEIAKSDAEVRTQIENAVKAEDQHWQDLDAARRRIKDRVVKILTKTPALSDQQVTSAVYLLSVGRSPTDEELKQFQQQVADTNDRPLSALQLTRSLVQDKEFNVELSTINDRLLQIPRDFAAKRAAGEIPVLFTADQFQKLTAECAATVQKAVKADEHFVNLAFLLTLARFPTATESGQFNAHLKKSPDRAKATQDVFFFLLNHQEFLMPK